MKTYFFISKINNKNLFAEEDIDISICANSSKFYFTEYQIDDAIKEHMKDIFELFESIEVTMIKECSPFYYSTPEEIVKKLEEGDERFKSYIASWGGIKGPKERIIVLKGEKSFDQPPIDIFDDANYLMKIMIYEQDNEIKFNASTMELSSTVH